MKTARITDLVPGASSDEFHITVDIDGRGETHQATVITMDVPGHGKAMTVRFPPEFYKPKFRKLIVTMGLLVRKAYEGKTYTLPIEAAIY